MKQSVGKQRGWLAVRAADGSPVIAATDPAAVENSIKGQSPPSQAAPPWTDHPNRQLHCQKLEARRIEIKNKHRGAKQGSTQNKSMQTNLEMGR